MDGPSKQTALLVEKLKVSYVQNKHPQLVLDSIGLELQKGEILALLGESGSGKSTIAKAITGLLPPSAQIADGTLHLAGQPPKRLADSGGDWSRLRGRGIAMLFQDAQSALNPVMRIREQFRETLLVHRLARSSEIEAVSASWLARLGFADPTAVLRCYPHELSGGMCQRICLALAACMRPQVLIADEPTSALDTVNQREVLRLLKSLQQELGLSVLLITHDLGLARAVSHRVIVLNKGSIVETGETAAVLAQPQHAYTRQLLSARELPPPPDATVSSSRQVPLLAIEELVKSYEPRSRVLGGATLQVGEGEIIGILGQSGCGKSTLARCILGLEEPDGGAILLRGQDITRVKGKARRRLARHVQLVFQDARGSLNPRSSALDLVQEPLRTFGIGTRQERIMRARLLLAEVGIAPEAQLRRPPQLSTGQCQRIAIARALALQPDILVCDEAVSALDMSVQAQILALLRRLHQQLGFAMIMISHDIRVLNSFCHQIAVMQAGRFIEIKRAGSELAASMHPHTQLLLGSADTEEAETREEKEAVIG